MSKDEEMLKVDQFIRRPIYVEAVQVTAENFKEVAEWCGGRVHNVSDGTTFIKVLGYKSKMIPRTKAFIGDWVLSGDKGFRVYTDSAFKGSFETLPGETASWPSSHEEALKTVFKENA